VVDTSTALLATCEDLVSRGRRAGADQIEAFLSDSRTTMIELANGELDGMVSAGNRGVGTRVIVGNSLGYAYSTDLSDQGRAELVERAVRLARESTPDQWRVLPDPRTGVAADLQIHDTEIPEIPPDRKLALLREAEEAARAQDPRVGALYLARYGDAVATSAIASSTGVSGAFRETGCYLSVSAIARQDGRALRGHAVSAARAFRDLDPREAGDRAAWRAACPLGGDLVPSQSATVVMEPEVAVELLRGVAQALTADAVQKGRSFLAGLEGAAVGSALVDIVDAGNLLGGYASAPFDGEGTPTQETTLIERGVVRGLLHSAYTARRAGAASTGNATRASYRTLPEVGATNLVLRPGAVSRDDLIRGVGRGLLVVSTRNVGGINPVSGDYSVGASGCWIERGELTHPVSGVTIASPMADMLRNISALGSALRWSPGASAYAAPVIRIDNVTIGGR
jgi:PmbA protein